MKLGNRFGDALAFAFQLHAAQLRKGTDVPYISHLLAVCAIVLEAGADEDTAIAALLHDAIEDQGGVETRQRIRVLFGDRVEAIVDACTDAETVPKPPWRPRKAAYVAHLRTAEPEARLISAADKLHNARAIIADLRKSGPRVWERFTGGREGTLWFYRAVVTALREGQVDGGFAGVVEELERAVATLEEEATRGAGA